MTSVARTCLVEGCTGTYKGRGFCRTHYNRMLKGLDLESPIRPKRDATCTYHGCDSAHVAKGYCSTHYLRHKNGRDMAGKKPKPPICTHPRCTNPVAYSELCQLHAQRRGRGRDMDTPKRVKETEDCSVPGCAEPFKCKGFCSRHYKKFRAYHLTAEKMSEMDSLPGCQICGKSARLHVDHDHSCCPGSNTCGNCVRGFLCSMCNQGLGQFADSPEVLTRAVRYLIANGIE